MHLLSSRRAAAWIIALAGALSGCTDASVDEHDGCASDVCDSHPELSFYAGPASSLSELRQAGGELWLGTLPVRRTSAMVVQTYDYEAIEALPSVVAVVPLGGGRGVYRVEVAPGVNEVALSRRIHHWPEVGWAHPDLIMPMELTYWPNDPYNVDQWHLRNDGSGDGAIAGHDIGAESAWDYATGSGVNVAVFDTGVSQHEDLNIIYQIDAVDLDGDASPDPNQTSYTHGTRCAGVIAARGDNGIGVTGVAYDADIIAMRGIGLGLPFSDLYQAIIEAIDNGADVISNSWSYSATNCMIYDVPQVLADALDYVEMVGRNGLGSVWVQSSGNAGCELTGDGLSLVETNVVVGAVNDLQELTNYSNYGAPLNIVGYSAGNGRPGLLTTTVPGTGNHPNANANYRRNFGGTSASAPLVAGVFALMLSSNPRLTAAEARQAMCDTALKIDLDQGQWNEDGWSPFYGCGLVDADAAVSAVVNTLPTVTLLHPIGEIEIADAELRWEGHDEQDEPLSYVVELLSADGSLLSSFDMNAESPIAIADLVAEEQSYQWRAMARDSYGDGPWSELASFTVVPPPEPEEPTKPTEPTEPDNEEDGGCGCQLVGHTTPAPPLWLLSGMLALGVMRRRRRDCAAVIR